MGAINREIPNCGFRGDIDDGSPGSNGIYGSPRLGWHVGRWGWCHHPIARDGSTSGRNSWQI